jgi:predicted metal-dependent hydrolase
VTAGTLEPVFRIAHLRLKPRSPVPEIAVEFFPFAGLSHTARLHEGRLYVRLSDICSDAPFEVYEALALILLARLYRKKVNHEYHQIYRAFTLRGEIQERTRSVRMDRGRPAKNGPAKGRHVDLAEAFHRLNAMYFSGTIEMPRLLWSARRARYVLGRYDAVHRIIFVSRIFDSPTIPSYVIEYILFHEMLHIKHASCVHDNKLMVHTPEFRREERSFASYDEAKLWLKNL